MFQVVNRHLEPIFFQLNSPKCDLGEVEKVMFEGLVWQFQLIFGFWTRPKCDLGEVNRRLFLWLEGNGNSISAS